MQNLGDDLLRIAPVLESVPLDEEPLAILVSPPLLGDVLIPELALSYGSTEPVVRALNSSPSVTPLGSASIELG